jgi:hypothetical protein
VGVTFGPDRAVWFTDYDNNAIGRFPTAYAPSPAPVKGDTGPPGTNGTNGAAGPAGPQGPAGKTTTSLRSEAAKSCDVVKSSPKQVLCQLALSTRGRSAFHATLRRRGKSVASGGLKSGHLLLRSRRRRVAHGTYTLVLKYKEGKYVVQVTQRLRVR